jgi:hypothetical protein
MERMCYAGKARADSVTLLNLADEACHVVVSSPSPSRVQRGFQRLR